MQRLVKICKVSPAPCRCGWPRRLHGGFRLSLHKIFVALGTSAQWETRPSAHRSNRNWSLALLSGCAEHVVCCGLAGQGDLRQVLSQATNTGCIVDIQFEDSKASLGSL